MLNAVLSADAIKQVQLAFFSAHFGKGDVKVADGLLLETLFRRSLVGHLGQATDAVSLQTTMQSGSCEMWNDLLQSIQAVMQWEQGVLAESHNERLFFDAQRG